MFVERVLSLNDGWSILTTQKNEEWAESSAALQSITEDIVLSSIEADTGDKEDSNYVAFYLYHYYNSYLRRRFNWNEVLPKIYGSIKHVAERETVYKNGVAASIVGLNELAGGDFITNLYVSSPYYYTSGFLSVNIILVPTQVSINWLRSLGLTSTVLNRLPTEEDCREQAAKFISLNNQAPVVLAFFSPTAPEEIAIEESSSLKIGEHIIERTIEFAPEHYQAGVGLLSYFGEVLRQKDPNTKAKVRIEQDGNKVRLHIESPSGDIETIEEELEKYALVISNKAAPESLFENRAYVMQLEHKLDVTRLELKQAYNTIALTDGLNSQRINNLEQQLDFLKEQVARQLTQTDKVIELAAQQTGSHERIQTALLAHTQVLFKDLLHEASGNQRLAEAVSSLQHNLLSGMATIDIEDKLEQALATIKETKPGFLGRIHKELEGAAYKAMASSTLTWVTTWIGTHTP